MTDVLSPTYLELDFTTLRNKLRDEIKESNIFNDVDYEGSNISTLIELIAYVGELQTYLANQIAKNTFIDTATLYENVHRLSNLIGYDPKGYYGAEGTLTVTLSGGYIPGDQIYVPAWSKFKTKSSVTYDNSVIPFSTMYAKTVNIPTSASSTGYTFDLEVIQGEYKSLSYTGENLIDNEIILPFFNYAHNANYDDETNPIKVYVNNEPWERVANFYDSITEINENDNVFKIEYDKYKRYKLVFSSTRNVPSNSDNINIYLLETLGTNGSVGKNTITDLSEVTFTNTSSNTVVSSSLVSVTNSVATTNASSPEIISEIKTNAKGNLRAQYRNVTSADYISYLEERNDITVANVWGEQDVSPSGDIAKYNKVYISLMPNTYTGTMSTSAGNVIKTTVTPSVSASVTIPTGYETSYTSTISEYLEPRKMLCAYEEYVVPSLVHFYFDFGIRIKRNYNFSNVSLDIKNKLIYYFRTANQDFGSTINFMDLINYILNTENVSSTNTFSNVAGIDNLIIRNIGSDKYIYEPNSSGNYPQYYSSQYTGDNRLRSITINNDQFPVLVPDLCTFTQET